jgi:hypothetical protein
MRIKSVPRLSLYTLFALALSIDYSFAAQPWQGTVTLALLIPIFLAVAAFMFLKFMGMQRHQAMVRDELYQALATAVIIGLLVSSMGMINDGTSDFICGITEMDPCDIDTTDANPITNKATQVVNDRTENMRDFLGDAIKYNTQLGEVAAQSGFCNMMSVGFSVAGCSAWGNIRSQVGQLINAATYAVMDLTSTKILLDLNTKDLTLGLILPVGILLRALTFTRKLGSGIIAMALSLYFVFPATFILTEQIAVKYLEDVNPSLRLDVSSNPVSIKDFDASEICDPFDPKPGPITKAVDDKLKTNGTAEKILFFVIARAFFPTVLALTATMTSIRAVGKLMATDIDISAIARLS